MRCIQMMRDMRKRRQSGQGARPAGDVVAALSEEQMLALAIRRSMQTD